MNDDLTFSKSYPRNTGAPATAYLLNLDGFRSVRLTLPNEFTSEEAERVIEQVRKHLARAP